MSAFPSAIARPAASAGPGAISRWLGACCDRIASHLARRAAIAWLRELDDAALRDIGITRSQIEKAVHGLISPNGSRRAPSAETVPWS